MKIKDLKEPYRSIAEFDCKKQGYYRYIDYSIRQAFVWEETDAGNYFYKSLFYGNYPPITEQIKLDYPEVFIKKEIENEFKFKVGDKITFPDWEDECFIIIDFIGKKRFFGTDGNGNEHNYSKLGDCILKEEPKEKIKLQKFYYEACDGWSIIYAESKEKLNGFKLLTEQEFLEQFEI